MDENRFVLTIKKALSDYNRQKIIGKNAAVKGAFECIYEILVSCGIESSHNAKFDSSLDIRALLCTKAGLVLKYTSSKDGMEADDFSGSYFKSRTEDCFAQSGDISIFDLSSSYLLLVAKEQAELPIIVALKERVYDMIRVLEDYNDESCYLLKCLDSMKTAISIYDKEANLLFANKRFCNEFFIADRDAVLGAPIERIFDNAGVTIRSMDGGSNRLKMHDVLENGKEALDWEVRIESRALPEQPQIASNDMYPIVNERGDVEGMVELARSRKQDLSRAKKIVGLAAEYSFDDIAGISTVIKDKIQIAKQFSDTPFPFLITGERGVGKELFAQSIHNHSSRHENPFVYVNCASLSEGMVENELFGFVGSSSNNVEIKGQIGKFELADKGTLFLDEISELPYHFQSSLLDALKTGNITRIGNSHPIHVDVRIVAATNKNLYDMVSRGLFRQDLYNRLNVLSIEIPPLRARKEDLLSLASTFLKATAEPGSQVVKFLEEEAEKVLQGYDWPGNIRELRNVISRAALLSKDVAITKDDILAAISFNNFMLGSE